jgi:predicted transcriptional regulator
MCTVEDDVMSRLAVQVAREDEEHAKTQALIVEAYQARNALRDIARITHLSYENVRAVLTRAGVEIRERGRPPKVD